MADIGNQHVPPEEKLLGGLLRDQRESSNVTQSEMAEALGVDQSLISRQEAGESKLDFLQVFEYLDVVNVSFMKFASLFEAEIRKLRGE